MTKTLTALTILLVSTSSLADEVSIVTPIIAKHTKERSHPSGDDWKETFFGKSIGLSYKHDSDFGATLVYANENSLRNKAWYATVDYMPTVYSYKNIDLNLGASLGFATGYPKKAKGISKTDPRFWGSLNTEVCYNKLCGMMNFVPAINVSPTFIFGVKYKIKKW